MTTGTYVGASRVHWFQIRIGRSASQKRRMKATGVSLNMPAVSVACTVLNESDDIDALVESLMRQTLAPAEVIIVDGGSTDGTWERLQAARSNTRR